MGSTIRDFLHPEFILFGVDDEKAAIKAQSFYKTICDSPFYKTTIENVELIKELDGITTYELPDNLLGIIWKGKYRGQKQKWFLMRFIGEDKEININTPHPEFLEWKWIELDQLTKVVVDFKLHVYKEVSEKIKKLI